MRYWVFAASIGFVLIVGFLVGFVTRIRDALPIWLIIMLAAMMLPILAVAFVAAAWSGKAMLEGMKKEKT